MTVFQLEKLVKEFEIIFWDFDGVIKDSVMVKSKGYEQLFLSYGKDVAERVRKHHEAHGGVSRYEKIPLYLSWVGEPADSDQVQEFCKRFSDLVQQAVINAPWVSGAKEYLKSNCSFQYFVLVTGTPQEEMEQILVALDLNQCFREVYGAPMAKSKAIKDVLKHLDCSPEKALMVGDSDSDLIAAEANRVPFLLRRTSLNQSLQKRYSGPMCNKFNYG